MTETPSQTVGPFLTLGLAWRDGHLAVPLGTPGACWVSGVLRDGAGEPVTDGLVETWQVEPEAFGRAATDAHGRYAIHTVKPGAVDGQAPHIDISVFARGLLDRVVTRLYFPDESAANAADPLLAAVGPERAGTLVARQSGADLVLDIHLRGPHETVFLTL
ncbi:protocatechuate 3,4-dioxygenase subunit alpha [Pseudonocardia sp.]|uniref:protocatechuate 3,4-dioxygenase subunit alpha n=1 Tax=Pseudonocardia sp. TaxID=60912 RepID=UPI002630C366|nr:protocatechuate 3,4-dioxygenase subunit alpha [Pseudonocardia sp.]